MENNNDVTRIIALKKSAENLAYHDAQIFREHYIQKINQILNNESYWIDFFPNVMTKSDKSDKSDKTFQLIQAETPEMSKLSLPEKSLSDVEIDDS